MWQQLFSRTLTSQWQLSELTTATSFKLAHTFNQNGSSYQPMALLALARLDEHNKLEIFSPQRIIPREESEIIQFSLLPFQWQYSIAIKLLVAPSRLSTQWSLQVDMPLYSTNLNPERIQVSNAYNSRVVTVSSEDYAQILNSNATRRTFRVVNSSAIAVYIGFNATFNQGNCIAILPSQSVYIDDIHWIGEVWANTFKPEYPPIDLEVYEYGLAEELVVS